MSISVPRPNDSRIEPAAIVRLDSPAIGGSRRLPMRSTQMERSSNPAIWNHGAGLSGAGAGVLLEQRQVAWTVLDRVEAGVETKLMETEAPGRASSCSISSRADRSRASGE